MKLQVDFSTFPDCYDFSEKQTYQQEINSYKGLKWSDVDNAISCKENPYNIIVIPRPKNESMWVLEISGVDIDSDTVFVRFNNSVS